MDHLAQLILIIILISFILFFDQTYPEVSARENPIERNDKLGVEIVPAGERKK